MQRQKEATFKKAMKNVSIKIDDLQASEASSESTEPNLLLKNASRVLDKSGRQPIKSDGEASSKKRGHASLRKVSVLSTILSTKSASRKSSVGRDEEEVELHKIGSGGDKKRQLK